MSEPQPVSDPQLRTIRVLGWVSIALGAVSVALRLGRLAVRLLHAHAESAARAVQTPGHPGAVVVQHGHSASAGRWIVWGLALVLAAVLIGGGIGLLRRRENGRVALVVAFWILTTQNALGAVMGLIALAGVVRMPPMVRQGIESAQGNHNLVLASLAAVGASLLFAIFAGVLVDRLGRPGVRSAMRPLRGSGSGE